VEPTPNRTWQGYAERKSEQLAPFRAKGQGAMGARVGDDEAERGGCGNGVPPALVYTDCQAYGGAMGQNLVLVPSVFSDYMEPMFGLSMRKIGKGGTENRYYGNQRQVFTSTRLPPLTLGV